MSGVSIINKNATVSEIIATLQELHPDAIVRISAENSGTQKEELLTLSCVIYNDKEVIFQTEEN